MVVKCSCAGGELDGSDSSPLFIVIHNICFCIKCMKSSIRAIHVTLRDLKDANQRQKLHYLF